MLKLCLFLFSLLAMASSGAQTTRPMLTSIETLHISTIAGSSDSNDCLTSATACRTFTGAINKVYQIDQGNYGVLILLDSIDATTGNITVWAPWVGGNPVNGPSGFGSSVTIRGDFLNPSNFTVSVTNNSCVKASYNATLNIEGLKCVVAGSGSGIYSSADAIVTISNSFDFGSNAGDHMLANSGGKILCSHNYLISGGGASHYREALGGTIECQNITAFVTNSITFSHSFAWGDAGGNLNAAGNSYNLGVNTVTGKKHDATFNAMLDSGGGDFPGTTAGTTGTGGQFR
jgi:hypothetical protein